MSEPQLDPSSAESGDAVAHRQLFRVLYGELHRIAERELRRVGGGSALSPTTVLHEAHIAIAARRSVERAGVSLRNGLGAGHELTLLSERLSAQLH